MVFCISYRNNTILPSHTLADDTFTASNVMKITEKVEDWEVLGILIGIREPKYKYDKIKQQHKDFKAQKEAIIMQWHDTHPYASWSLLHQALSMMGETKAAQDILQLYLKG